VGWSFGSGTRPLRRHPAGRILTDRAHSAQRLLTVGAEAVSRAVLASAPLRGETGRIALVADRIVAGWWETIEPPARARKPEDQGAMISLSVSRRVHRQRAGRPSMRTTP